MKTLIDANVILRYVLNDIQEMGDKASLVINEGSFTTVEILAEVSYVLRNVYKMPKPEAAKTIKAVLLEVEIEQKILFFMLWIYLKIIHLILLIASLLQNIMCWVYQYFLLMKNLTNGLYN